MSEKVVVRFCPSPTGPIHIGSVRTGLFVWLIAKQNKGKFILRIEDTDKKREIEGGVQIIKDTLQAVNLDWDEFALQSENKEVHKKYGQMLYEKGLAYADNVTPEEVADWRNDAQSKKKPFLYRDYITTDRIVPWEYGKNALRLKSNPKKYTWHDEVRGDLSSGPESIDDLVLIKADGLSTYNFCHIVDDYEMGVTHIFRADEFISSTPKYLNIYEALEIEHPKFVTLAPIMAENGKKKLGKRDGAKDVLEYLQDGVLVEGLLNFLALLGWNPGKGSKQEIFSIEELIKEFSIDGIGKSGANYDIKRLEWINGHHIRMKTVDELYELSEDFWSESANNSNEKYKKQVLTLIQERLKFLKEIPELTNFFFEEPNLTKEQLMDVKNLEDDFAKELLESTLDTLQNSSFGVEDIQAKLNGLLEVHQTKPGILFALIRNAVSGSRVTPGIADMLSVLGKDRVTKRINNSLKVMA
ncbi:MAG: glutamate--tRNA ligase [Candidatus Nomurabacteria bacterium]|nr:MAG: glutamate--tRNA ligase [Candidatus Nomurabacteria bacterium]HRV75837.1 glutamate--tRNA ligase [Candidatus Saccharimonadales bacterium]